MQSYSPFPPPFRNAARTRPAQKRKATPTEPIVDETSAALKAEKGNWHAHQPFPQATHRLHLHIHAPREAPTHYTGTPTARRTISTTYISPMPSATRERRYNSVRMLSPPHMTKLLVRLVELFDFRKPHRREVDIPLNGKSQRPSRVYQFRKQKVAKLLFKTNHPAEEHICTVKLAGVPRPGAIRCEELAEHERIWLMFLRVQWGKLCLQLLRQQFHAYTSLPLMNDLLLPNDLPKLTTRRNVDVTTLPCCRLSRHATRSFLLSRGDRDPARHSASRRYTTPPPRAAR